MTLSAARLRVLTASLLVVAFLGALDHTVVSTSLTTIAGDLGALEQMSWIVVSYTLASTIVLPVVGALGDGLGPRRVFLTCLALFLLASLSCGLAPNMPTLIGARVIQGMSSAGLQLMSQTIIAHATTPRERPGYLSVIGAAFPVAILIGPAIGGAVTDYWGWPWVFWINLPIGLIAFAFAFGAVPRVRVAVRRGFDLPGTAVFTIAMLALILGVTWLPDPDLALTSWGLLATAVVSTVAFVMIELRTPAPLIPMHLFRTRAIAASTVLSAVIGTGLLSITAYLPTYFQMAYRTSVTVSGLVPIATVFGMLLSNLATGWIVGRTGRYRLYPLLGSGLGAAGLTAMALLPSGLPLWIPTVAMFVVGVGTGAFMNLVVAVAQSAAHREQIGAVTAVVNLVRQVGATTATAVIGGTIGVAAADGLAGRFDASSITPELVHASPVADQLAVVDVYSAIFSPIFGGLAVIYAVGIAAALLLPRTSLGDSAHTAAPDVVAEHVSKERS